MKHLFIITMVLALVSCGIISKGTGAYAGTDIKGLKVAKIATQENFSDYSQECNEAADYFISLVNLSQEYSNKAAFAALMHRLYNSCNNSKAREYEAEYKNAQAKADSLNKVVLEYEPTLNSILENHKEGIVYVACFKTKNEFGKWNDFNSYGVYTYNDKGEIYQYAGPNAVKLILTIYPDAKEDIQKTVSDAFIEAVSDIE